MKKRTEWPKWLKVLTLLVVLLLWPAISLIAKVKRNSRLTGGRIRKGYLEFPVIHYIHPQTGRAVVFIATIHLAEPTYFARLQEIINELQQNGYQILFEFVAPLTEDQEAGLSEAGLKIASEMEHCAKAMRLIAEITALQPQRDGLEYAKEWVNTDIRRVDFINHLAQKQLSFFNLKVDVDGLLKDETAKQFILWLLDKALALTPVHGFFITLAMIFSRSFRQKKKIILGKRNKIAFDGVDSYLVQSNVATIWGAAHWYGINKMLQRAGFRMMDIEWVRAYQIKGLKLRSVLKTYLNEHQEG